VMRQAGSMPQGCSYRTGKCISPSVGENATICSTERQAPSSAKPAEPLASLREHANRDDAPW